MEPEQRTHTTKLLRAVTDGETGAAQDLLPIVYDELRRIAGRLMDDQSGNRTLQPTELIHEAYLRLIVDDHDDRWESRVHFTRVAARAMRFVLVDHVRSRGSGKRGGDHRRVTLNTQVVSIADRADELLAVHDGLEQLSQTDEQLASIVELRFFAGLTMEEIAAAIGTSLRTAERGWRVAKAWWIDRFGEGEHAET